MVEGQVHALRGFEDEADDEAGCAAPAFSSPSIGAFSRSWPILVLALLSCLYRDVLSLCCAWALNVLGSGHSRTTLEEVRQKATRGVREKVGVRLKMTH